MTENKINPLGAAALAMAATMEFTVLDFHMPYRKPDKIDVKRSRYRSARRVKNKAAKQARKKNRK